MKIPESLNRKKLNNPSSQRKKTYLPQMKKTKDNTEKNMKKTTQSKKSVNKREDAQKKAVEVVAANLLPTLPGGFAIQFGTAKGPSTCTTTTNITTPGNISLLNVNSQCPAAPSNAAQTTISQTLTTSYLQKTARIAHLGIVYSKWSCAFH